MPDTALFELSSEIDPPKRFAIDGESYDLKDLGHLSDKEEARFRVCLTKDERNGELLRKAIEAGNEVQADKISMQTRVIREELIGIMTTVPAEIVRRLGPRNHATLMQAIMQGPEVVALRLKREAELKARDERIKARVDAGMSQERSEKLERDADTAASEAEFLAIAEAAESAA